jgi:starvation-inducible DNA-binding protein
MFPTKNSLSAANRKKIIAQLSPLLSDAQDLYSQTKQAHWNVRGANFIALHELFDKIAGEVNDAVDMIAERIAQLGGSPTGTIRVAAKQSRLKEYPLSISDGAKHIDALSSALAAFNAFMVQAIEDTDDLDDEITSDMCTQIARGFDQQLWFLEAHTQK